MLNWRGQHFFLNLQILMVGLDYKCNIAKQNGVVKTRKKEFKFFMVGFRVPLLSEKVP